MRSSSWRLLPALLRRQTANCACAEVPDVVRERLDVQLAELLLADEQPNNGPREAIVQTLADNAEQAQRELAWGNVFRQQFAQDAVQHREVRPGEIADELRADRRRIGHLAHDEPRIPVRL